MIVRPASSTSTFSPFSVSSFAAHPPVIPDPTMIASYIFVAAMFASPPNLTRKPNLSALRSSAFSALSFSSRFPALSLRLCGKSLLASRFQLSTSSSVSHSLADLDAAVLRSRDNLQFQFLREPDFRRVIPVQRNPPEDIVEVALELRVQLRHRIAVLLSPLSPLRHRVVIHRAQQRHLLQRRRIHKIFPEQFPALFVDARKSRQEILPLGLRGPFRQNHVDKLIHARRFGSRRVRLRNNQVRHRHHCTVLVRIQRAQLVSRPGLRLRFTKKSRQRRRKNRKHRSGSQHLQYIAPLHAPLPLKFAPLAS